MCQRCGDTQGRFQAFAIDDVVIQVKKHYHGLGFEGKSRAEARWLEGDSQVMYRTTHDCESGALNQKIHIPDNTCELDCVNPGTLHDEIREARTPAAPRHLPVSKQTLEQQPET